MRLRQDVVDKFLEENDISLDQFARLYRGARGEYWVMCNIKCGFKRAYQIAEIMHCSVDDIVVYTEDKWPRWHRPVDDGRTKAGRARLKKEREKQKKLEEKRLKEERECEELNYE